MPHGAAIYFTHWNKAGEGSGNESLVGTINIIKRELFFKDVNAAVAAAETILKSKVAGGTATALIDDSIRGLKGRLN